MRIILTLVALTLVMDAHGLADFTSPLELGTLVTLACVVIYWASGRR